MNRFFVWFAADAAIVTAVALMPHWYVIVVGAVVVAVYEFGRVAGMRQLGNDLGRSWRRG